MGEGAQAIFGQDDRQHRLRGGAPARGDQRPAAPVAGEPAQAVDHRHRHHVDQQDGDEPGHASQVDGARRLEPGRQPGLQAERRRQRQRGGEEQDHVAQQGQEGGERRRQRRSNPRQPQVPGRAPGGPGALSVGGDRPEHEHHQHPLCHQVREHLEGPQHVGRPPPAPGLPEGRDPGVRQGTGQGHRHRQQRRRQEPGPRMGPNEPDRLPEHAALGHHFEGVLVASSPKRRAWKAEPASITAWPASRTASPYFLSQRSRRSCRRCPATASRGHRPWAPDARRAARPAPRGRR